MQFKLWMESLSHITPMMMKDLPNVIRLLKTHPEFSHLESHEIYNTLMDALHKNMDVEIAWNNRFSDIDGLILSFDAGNHLEIPLILGNNSETYRLLLRRQLVRKPSKIVVHSQDSNDLRQALQSLDFGIKSNRGMLIGVYPSDEKTYDPYASNAQLN